MAMPEHLRASQGVGVALAHRRESRRLEREVRDALKAAVFADVKSVKAFVSDGRYKVVITCRPWHDVGEIAAVVAQVEGISQVAHLEGSRNIIATRKISGQK